MAKAKKKKAVKASTKKTGAKKSKAKKTNVKKVAPKKKIASKKATASKKVSSKKIAPKNVASKATAAKKIVAKKSVEIKAAAKKSLNVSELLTPLDDRILLKLTEMEKKTAGGLYIPETVSDVEGQLRGHVVAVGRGRMDKKGKIHPLDVKVGDQVVLPEFAGSKVIIQEQEFLFVRESEVLAIQTK